MPDVTAKLCMDEGGMYDMPHHVRKIRMSFPLEDCNDCDADY